MSRMLCWLVAGALGCVIFPLSARADALDKKLHDEMPGIMKSLRAKGYKNIGVLPFKAQRGRSAESFSLGPINQNMTERLGNLLIIHGGAEEARAIGVIRSAGPTAAQAGVRAWSRNVEQRRKLFTIQYPLAWGHKKVKADAFLTGMVKNVGDRSRTTVTIQFFDRKDPARLSTLTEFTLKTDRSLVRDLGSSFNLSARTMRAMRGKSSFEADWILIRAIARREDQQNKKNAPQGKEKEKKNDPQGKDHPPAKQSSPSNVGGIEVKILGGEGLTEETIRESSSGSTKWEVQSPIKDKPVVITLRNTTQNPLAVVLKLNGISTILEQKAPSDQCRKWVIPGGTTYSIKGFYTESEEGKVDKVKVFKVLEGDEAKAKIEELGPTAGLIEVDVFAKDFKPAPGDMGITPRAVVSRKAQGSYTSLRAALMKRNFKSKWVGTREIIVPDVEAIRTDLLKETEFKDPGPVGTLQIKVVPREGNPPQ